MECSENSETHLALRGHLYALWRLDFDQPIPARGPSTSACRADCGDSNLRCFGFSWASGDKPFRPLCQFSSSQLEGVLTEAKDLLDKAHGRVRELRTAFRKPACV